jgi:serine/threonine protein kinase
MGIVTSARYELLGLLATGGMAEVHVAKQHGVEGFTRLVAIKRILQGRDYEGDLVAMFLEEARLAAHLRHPNVVVVHDCGVLDGRYFLAMELVHGADVRTLLETGPRLERDEAIAIAIGACAGLHHAHEQRDADGKPLGIIHRDVSPSNVLISYDGGVKVADFGIARAADRQSWTAPGSVRGKVGYLSPEQVRDEVLDRRSDVFALGLLLYELVTGVRAYDGPVAKVLTRVLAGPPDPPSMHDPLVPAELEAIILRAVAHDREARYPTARALQEDLENFARMHQLATSSLTVERMMAKRFEERARAYRAAEERGTLIEHVLETATIVDRPIGRGRQPAEAAATPPPASQRPTATADVSSGSSTPSPAPGSSLPVAPLDGIRPVQRRGGRGILLGIGAAALLAIGAVWFATRDEPRTAASASQPPGEPVDHETAVHTPDTPKPTLAATPEVEPAAAEPTESTPTPVTRHESGATAVTRHGKRPAKRPRPTPKSSPKSSSSKSSPEKSGSGSAAYWDPESALPPGR